MYPSQGISLYLGIADVKHESERNQRIINANLQDNWNCVILETSQTVLNLDGVHDMQYDYDEEGDLTGFTFKMYTDVYKFYVHPEEGSRRSLATLGVNKNNKYVSNSSCLSKTMNVFNITNDIFYDPNN